MSDPPHDIESAGSVVERLGLLSVPPPTPVGRLKEAWGTEYARKRARRLIDSDELQYWLDTSIQKGDHNLQRRDRFHWDDIHPRYHYGLKWMLAMRYLESRYNDNDKPIPPLEFLPEEDLEGFEDLPSD